MNPTFKSEVEVDHPYSNVSLSIKGAPNWYLFFVPPKEPELLEGVGRIGHVEYGSYFDSSV